MSVENNILNRILSHSQGWCFTLFNFMGMGSDESIRKALSSLQQKQVIRRLSQGVYDYPKKHEVLGLIPADPLKVAKAIAIKNGVNIQPSGAYAANILGFSEQVPGKIVFLSEGPSKTIVINNCNIHFKKASIKSMHAAGTTEGLLIQALKHIGKNHINNEALHKIHQILRQLSFEDIQNNMKYAPAWIRSLIFKLIKEKKISQPKTPSIMENTYPTSALTTLNPTLPETEQQITSAKSIETVLLPMDLR